MLFVMSSGNVTLHPMLPVAPAHIEPALSEQLRETSLTVLRQ
jgi:hypothetical protein